jgi:uncharacterized integral membrane protein
MTSLPPDDATPDHASGRPAVSGPDPEAVRPDTSAAREKDAPAAAGLDRRGRVKRTRASGLWIGVVSAAVLAILFLVFIAQNSEKVTIAFLGFDGRLSLAIALLLSAVIGALVVAVPGIVRIGQLRRALLKNAKH